MALTVALPEAVPAPTVPLSHERGLEAPPSRPCSGWWSFYLKEPSLCPHLSGCYNNRAETPVTTPHSLLVPRTCTLPATPASGLQRRCGGAGCHSDPSGVRLVRAAAVCITQHILASIAHEAHSLFSKTGLVVREMLKQR